MAIDLKLTADMLKLIASNADQKIILGLQTPLNRYLPKYGIDEYLEVAHFLGQAAEETAGFKTLNEYGDNDYFTRHYEGRSDLGNTQPGDGARFHGRGIFQITGRHNYDTLGHKIGIDLVKNPTLAGEPETAVILACEFWVSRNLSAFAKADDVFHVSSRINGINRKTNEPNGLNDRKAYTAKAKSVIKGLWP
jgi:putative chitinase